MKYCSKCGNELYDEAVICPKCGCAVEGVIIKKAETSVEDSNTLKTVAKVFMIISTVILGLYIIPLAWTLPMTIIYCDKVNKKKHVGIAFKICSLIFVNIIAGILMLCDRD